MHELVPLRDSLVGREASSAGSLELHGLLQPLDFFEGLVLELPLQISKFLAVEEEYLGIPLRSLHPVIWLLRPETVHSNLHLRVILCLPA